MANKTSELALRKALGASSGDTVAVLAKYVSVPCAGGLVIGCLGGWLLARTMSSELVGVVATDLASMAATVVCVFAVGVVAGVGPMSRAFVIDPARALRAA